MAGRGNGITNPVIRYLGGGRRPTKDKQYFKKKPLVRGGCDTTAKTGGQTGGPLNQVFGRLYKPYATNLYSAVTRRSIA